MVAHDSLPIIIELIIDTLPIDLQISYQGPIYDSGEVVGYIWRFYAKFESYYFTVGPHSMQLIASDVLVGEWFNQIYPMNVLPEP